MIPTLATAQAAIARFDDVKGLEDRGSSCFASKTVVADPLALRRVRNGKIESAWPNDSVIANGDRIVIARRTDARIHVEVPLGLGNIYLAPELGRCPGSEIGRHIVGRSTTAAGSYEFRRDTVGRGAAAQDRLVMSIRNGAAVVQWRSGPLMVRALNEQITDLGSTFTIIVDSAANRGVITVQEGVVSMRAGSLRAIAGQSYTFGVGQQVQPVAVRTAGLDEIRFHSDEVWNEPRSALSYVPKPKLPSLPWRFIIPTAGLSAGGYYAWKALNKPKAPPVPPVKAVVVISIPL